MPHSESDVRLVHSKTHLELQELCLETLAAVARGRWPISGTTFAERCERLFDQLVGTKGMTKKPLGEVRHRGSPPERGGIRLRFPEIVHFIPQVPESPWLHPGHGWAVLNCRF